MTDFETRFVRKIDYDYLRVTIFYTFPIQNRDGRGDGHGSEDWGSKRRVNAFSWVVSLLRQRGLSGMCRLTVKQLDFAPDYSSLPHV